ncbi:MAG: trans-aconitate 2-methyltransferase [Polyangiales bacterium]
MTTWDPAQYLRFADERTRPCRELAARVALAAPARIIDLGCGPGNSTEVLAQRWPEAELTGLDSSAAMIEAAQRALPRARWMLGDIDAWARDEEDAYDLVFANASMQWVDDHATAFPAVIERVARGGALAVQMPANHDAPAHAAMRELAASPRWRARFETPVRSWAVRATADYYDLLAPRATAVDLWDVEYMHVMPDHRAIVEWYRGTGLRPFLDRLADEPERARFTDEYLALLERAYPRSVDGRVLLPFRRRFVIAYR